MKKLFVRCFVFCGLALGPVDAWAHPHIWIASQAEVVVQDKIVQGFWATWTFDEMFSTILTDFPHDSQGHFSSAANHRIMEQDFNNLRNFHYFCWVYWNGKPVVLSRITQFESWLTAGGTRAVYRFFVPIDRKIQGDDELTLAMYDDSYYTQILWAKEAPLTISGAKGAVVFRPDQARAYYGGFVVPVEAHIRWEN